MAVSSKRNAWQIRVSHTCSLGKLRRSVLHAKCSTNLLLPFQLVRGLTTVYLVGGLSVEEQQHNLRQTPILLGVICGCGVQPHWKSVDQNEEQWVNCNNKLEILLPLVLLIFYGIILNMCSCVILRRSIWALTVKCKNCSSMAPPYVTYPFVFLMIPYMSCIFGLMTFYK